MSKAAAIRDARRKIKSQFEAPMPDFENPPHPTSDPSWISGYTDNILTPDDERILDEIWSERQERSARLEARLQRIVGKRLARRIMSALHDDPSLGTARP